MLEKILNLIPEEEIIKYIRKKGYKVIQAEKQKKAIEKARQVKSKNIQEKIKIAIQELQEQGKDINPYSVSKQAKINYRTAMKYLKKDPISLK